MLIIRHGENLRPATVCRPAVSSGPKRYKDYFTNFTVDSGWNPKLSLLLRTHGKATGPI